MYVWKTLFAMCTLLLSISIIPISTVEADNSLLSIRKQLSYGVPAYYIACKENLALAIKKTSDKPVCIKPSNISRFIKHGYEAIGNPIDVVSTLDYEKRKLGSPVLFCYLYSITTNDMEQNKSETMKIKFLIYNNLMTYPNDWVEIMYPGNKLIPELKGKSVHLVGTQVENHGPFGGCGKYVLDEKTGLRNLVPDIEPVINPSKIEILNR